MESVARKTLFLFFGLAFLSSLFVSGCTSDTFDPGINGNAYLQDLSIENMKLVPDFSPTTYSYQAIRSGGMDVKALVQPYVYATSVTLNGKTVRMDTNMYGLPVETLLVDVVTNNVLVINAIAQDGLSRTYTVQFLDENYDSGIQSIASSSGQLYPAFEEGLGPYYKVTTPISINASLQYTNVYELIVNDATVDLTFVKTNAGSVLTVNGSSVVDSTPVTVNAPSTVYITNVSANGVTTNVKFIKVVQVNAAQDAAISDVKVNSGAIRFFPDFYQTQNDYTLTLDDVFSVDFNITKQTAAATLIVSVTNPASGSSRYVLTNNSTALVDVSSLSVNMADIVQLTVISSDATVTNTYNFAVSIYTRQEYGFDGKISDFLDFVISKGEIKEADGYTFAVEGIVTATYVNYAGSTDAAGAQGAFIIEDGGYALYVWNYGIGREKTWGSSGDIGPLYAGQHVKLTFVAGKMWRGLPEATGGWSSSVEVINRTPRALFYHDGSVTGWQDFERSCKIYKFDGKVLRDMDDSGRSLFQKDTGANGGDFKVFHYSDAPYSDGAYKSVVPYLSAGTSGKFFGPIYYDSGEGYMMMMENQNQVILD